MSDRDPVLGGILAAFPGVRELSFLQILKHISTALFDSYYFLQPLYLE